jgi:hypothetical protein
MQNFFHLLVGGGGGTSRGSAPSILGETGSSTDICTSSAADHTTSGLCPLLCAKTNASSSSSFSTSPRSCVYDYTKSTEFNYAMGSDEVLARSESLKAVTSANGVSRGAGTLTGTDVSTGAGGGGANDQEKTRSKSGNIDAGGGTGSDQSSTRSLSSKNSNSSNGSDSTTSSRNSTSSHPHTSRCEWPWIVDTREVEKYPENELFVGAYAKQRANRDYTYHKHYIHERQLWQDKLIDRFLRKFLLGFLHLVISHYLVIYLYSTSMN